MSDFSSFKKQLNKINENLKDIDPKKASYVDERFWNVTKDSTGNGAATIRFLPQKDPAKLLGLFVFVGDEGLEPPTLSV